jgi:thiamine-monophosphate kinase
VGEFELLEKIRRRLPPDGRRIVLGSGDDAAVTVPGGATATSVDAIVEGVHFSREQASLSQIGARALATALSDLAAMGADPGEAYAVLTVPPDLDEEQCLELLDGMVTIAAETGTTIAGGDLTRGAALALAVTVVGHAERPESLVGRAGGRPGDLLAITGEIGGAAAGLLTLERPETAAGIAAETAARLRSRLLEPTPRLAAGAALARAGATAMIDLSDGLGGDAGRLAEAGGTGVSIDAARLPIAAGVEEVAAAAGIDPVQLAVSGGEDYELLAALPPERLEEAVRAVADSGIELTPVGELDGSGAVEIRLPGGGLLEPRGFDQLD